MSSAGIAEESEDTYYDIGDIAGLILVAVAGGLMIIAFSGMAAYKQYVNEISKQ